MADEIFFGMKEKRRRCWLDVKMVKCDVAAMEEGVRHSDCLIAIVTDNGTDSYFSRGSECDTLSICEANCSEALLTRMHRMQCAGKR